MIKDLELSKCLDLLGNNYIGRLAFISHGEPYIIPITYFHDSEEKSILSYAAKGHKIEAMRNYDSVALQVDEIKSIQEWRSVLVHGKFEELKGSTAKKYLHRFAEGVQD
ncbi:MAG: pyridoxamine 5'-phosphate oxidase family protein, partial [Aurantibacter sp.]